MTLDHLYKKLTSEKYTISKTGEKIMYSLTDVAQKEDKTIYVYAELSEKAPVFAFILSDIFDYKETSSGSIIVSYKNCPQYNLNLRVA